MEHDTSQKRYNSALEIIEKRLLPDETAKKARGEVFTPLSLVREMLFGIRKSSISKGKIEVWGYDETNGEFIDDDENDRIGGIPLEIFRDPETKWLDPANGIGNFPVIAFYMLDYQLDKHGKEDKFKGDKNKQKRREHIIKNMLYMIEINKGNVNTTKKIFNLIVPDIQPNICCANTLQITDEKLLKNFGVNRFDVVMGNPPFNESLEDNPVGHAQDTGLWESFVKISLDLFVKNNSGVLAFLHPARWRQPDHKLHDYLFSKQFLFLAIFNKKEGQKQFKAVTRFDYYILQNKDTKDKTPVKFENGVLSFININKEIPFIANYGQEIWEILLKSNIENIKVLGGGSSIKYSNNDHVSNDNCPASKPYLNINTTAKTDKVSKKATYKKTRKNSNSSSIYVDIVCSSNKHPLQDNKKVIFSKNEVIYSFYDEGKYGLTSNAFCILVKNKDEGLNLVKFLNSKFIKFLIASVKFGNFSTAKNIFDYIPNPLKISNSFSENDFLNYLKLSKSQINLIQNNKEDINQEETEGGSKKLFNKTRKVRKH
jgi:hypothetical protein